MLLGILLGNSRLRYGILAGDAVLAARTADLEAVPSIGEEIGQMASSYGAERIVVGSVRDDLLPVLESALPERYRRFRLARRDFPIPIENAYARPEEAGTDRLLAALAAKRRAGDRGAVVLDFGTALSVSVVSPGGVFLGGSIAAGWRCLAAGLAKRTPRLPELGRPPREASRDSRGSFPFVNRDTSSALRSGAFWEIAGGARALLVGTLAEIDFRPLVIATGGDAAIFAAAIPEIDEVVPELGLEGLAIASQASDR